MMVGADGVHLGQDDMPVDAARALLGDSLIIGISTHTLEQVNAAAKLPVDYIAIGPVFATSSKADHEQPIGLSGVTAARDLAGDIPLVAIGGIDSSNVLEIFAAGANSAAMISAVVAGGDQIESHMRRLRELVTR